MTPRQLARKFGKAPARESIAAAASRAAAFARAMQAHGHADLVAERGGKVIPSAGGRPSPSAAAIRTVARAEKRFGAPLPASVVELWQVLGCKCCGAFLVAFCTRRLVDPRELVTPPAWAKDARLSCIRRLDGSGVTDARERFTLWGTLFAEAKPKVKVSRPEQLARVRSDADRRSGVMLDPALREGIICIATAPSEVWFVMTGLASKAALAPVFARHNDGEGYSEYVATDVRAWFSGEVTASMADIATPEG